MIKLSWPPSVNACYRFHKGRFLLSKKGRDYKKLAGMELMAQKAPKFGDKRIAMLINVYPPDRRKRDIDNLLKLLLDVLESYGVFDNDEQVDDLRIQRFNIVKGGKVEILIS